MAEVTFEKNRSASDRRRNARGVLDLALGPVGPFEKVGLDQVGVGSGNLPAVDARHGGLNEGRGQPRQPVGRGWCCVGTQVDHEFAPRQAGAEVSGTRVAELARRNAVAAAGIALGDGEGVVG